MNQADVDLYKRFQKSPIFFIERTWGLVPQPLLPEFKSFEQEPEKLVEEMFQPFVKGKHLTWQQWQLLLCVELAIQGKRPKRIAIESGQGVGKTAALAWLILWFLFCHKDARVPCTAPTVEQMYDALWREVYLWLDRMPPKLKDLFEWTSDVLKVKERPETWFARARTARKEKPEALAGIHGEHILVIVDEASGIDDEIFRIAEGMLTGENVLFIMISQHQRLVGYFHTAFNSDKAAYQTLRFSSIESPVVDSQFVRRIADKYGKDSDVWRVQVLGMAPKEDSVDDKGYVPLLTESDIRIGPDVPLLAKKRLGVDPSGEGNDETSWAERDAYKARIPLVEKISNSLSIAAKTFALLDTDRIEDKETWVDNFGEGANVAVELAKGRKYVNAVNVGQQAEDNERFLNKRAEATWRMREWLRKGGELIGHHAQELKEELLTLRYRYGTAGKIQIMSKEDMRKNGFKSPNKADALMLTFVEPETNYRTKVETEEPFDRYSVL